MELKAKENVTFDISLTKLVDVKSGKIVTIKVFQTYNPREIIKKCVRNKFNLIFLTRFSHDKTFCSWKKRLQL